MFSSLSTCMYSPPSLPPAPTLSTSGAGDSLALSTHRCLWVCSTRRVTALWWSPAYKGTPLAQRFWWRVQDQPGQKENTSHDTSVSRQARPFVCMLMFACTFKKKCEIPNKINLEMLNALPPFIPLMWRHTGEMWIHQTWNSIHGVCQVCCVSVCMYVRTWVCMCVCLWETEGGSKVQVDSST